MKVQLVLVMILSTLFFANCEKVSNSIDNQASMSDYVVNYGTSFGMCLGPCRKEMNFLNGEVSFTVFYTEGRGAIGGTPKTFKETLDATLANSLLKSIDYESFKKLNERIGCPDCADGGAEWVEIMKGDSKHKVTFEFGKAPKEIESLVTILREKKVYFEEKYLK
ncbi:MAG: hypothetical protein U5M51_01655 [Emticicia sp.]|nr:hypothetical protein [Emticicia sp.]